MDMDFIEQLSTQVYKYIAMKVRHIRGSPLDTYLIRRCAIRQSFPKDKEAIFPADYSGYPTAPDVHKFVTKSGLTTVPLSLEDVRTLIDRLFYDGKITKIQKAGHDLSDSDRMDVDDDDDEDGEVVREMHDMWMYKAVRGSALEERNAWTDMPCGKCPVFDFCTEGGPVNPGNCIYFKEWLSG